MNSEIVVVSGLPRSGTSLMMQLLAAGGIAAFTDGQRAADDDNPRGYFELEQVKRLKQDATWLPAARGQALKVISQLLFDLPPTEHYRIVFMERDLEEVLASQEKMIARGGGKAAPRAALRAAFKAHLTKLESWVADQPHLRLLRINYAALIAHPREQIDRLVEFLADIRPQGLDLEAMLAAIDPTLYRNRNPGSEIA